MRFGLDYAWTTISAAAHRSVGSSFACRYLSNDSTKNLSKGEADALRAGGIDIVAVWETTETRALDGLRAGAQDATEALAQALPLGLPQGRPIYFAADFDEAPGQAGAVSDYFRGINSVLGVGRTGCYGGYWAVSRLFNARLIRYGWQTYAWSGGQLDPRAQLYQFSNGHQVAGRSCDYNHALAPDFGQFGYAVAHKANAAGGKALAHLEFDVETGHWTIQPLPGPFAPGGPSRWASLELQFNPSDGGWRIQPLPWNAAPLGG